MVDPLWFIFQRIQLSGQLRHRHILDLATSNNESPIAKLTKWTSVKIVEICRKKSKNTSLHPWFSLIFPLFSNFSFTGSVWSGHKHQHASTKWNLFRKVTVVACEGPSIVIRSSTVAIWGALMAKRVFAPIWSKSFHRSFCPANTCPQTVRRSQLSARNVRFSL